MQKCLSVDYPIKRCSKRLDQEVTNNKKKRDERKKNLMHHKGNYLHEKRVVCTAPVLFLFLFFLFFSLQLVHCSEFFVNKMRPVNSPSGLLGVTSDATFLLFLSFSFSDSVSGFLFPSLFPLSLSLCLFAFLHSSEFFCGNEKLIARRITLRTRG